MNRTFLLTPLAALIASSAPCRAQAKANLPVIRPTVTELGEFRDTTLRAELTPEEAALSPRGTLIAYTTKTEEDLRIWNVSTHTNRVVLRGFSEAIAWSPAGDAIAFAHEGDQGWQEQIWMLRLNPVTGESVGSPQRVSLTPTTGNSPQFSPDGKSIAFPRRDSGQHTSLVVVPATGGTERVLASGYHIRKLRWAVDGSAIFYASYRDSTMTKAMLSRVALNGGAPQLVHDYAGESLYGADAPALSPDNRVVLLHGQAVGAEDALRAGDPSGRAVATLSIPGGVQIGDWSGPYRHAGVRQTVPRGLRIINVADGKSQDLIDSTADVQAVSWFEDSRRLAAIVFYDGAGVLVTMNADGTGMRKIPLASPPSRYANVSAPPVERLRVSPDGRYAVYLGPGFRLLSGRSLELVDLSTGRQQTLTSAREIMQPLWRSDSRTVRYMRMAEGSQTDPHWLGVHDVSLDGTDKLVREFPLSQYPNATWLMAENYVSNFRGDKFTLARLDGTPDQIALRASISNPGAISADGRTMAMSPGEGGKDSTRKVILISLSDGGQRTVVLPLAQFFCGSFSRDGRYVYCRGRKADADPLTLYEVPVDGSKPRVVARSNSKENAGAYALSPDGKWMLETVAGVRRAAFVSLDYTDGMTRLLSSPSKR